MRPIPLCGLLLVVGCSRENYAFNAGESTGTVSSTTASVTDSGVDRPTSTSEGTTYASTSGADPTTTSSDVDSSGGQPPLCFEEIGKPCDPFDPVACPKGEKCSPLAALGDGPGARCIPLIGPTEPGDRCTWECEGTQDDCGFDQICVPENDGDVEGVCIGLCQEPNPCPLPNTLCIDLDDFGLCLLGCHPLDPATCPADGLCVPFDEGFACVGPEDDTVGIKGDTCFEQFECAFGLACVPTEVVPGCEDRGGLGAGCCTPYCSLTKTECPIDTECVEFPAPPIVTDLGVCLG